MIGNELSNSHNDNCYRKRHERVDPGTLFSVYSKVIILKYKNMEQNISTPSTSQRLETLETQRNTLDRKIALLEVLKGYNLITSDDDISETVDAITLRKEDLKVTHKKISNEAAVALAYLDIKVTKAKESHVSVGDIVDTIPREFISALIMDKHLKSNKEFIDTIIPKIKLLLAENDNQFSDILLWTVDERQKKHSDSNIQVIVDGATGTVLVPSDLH